MANSNEEVQPTSPEIADTGTEEQEEQLGVSPEVAEMLEALNEGIGKEEVRADSLGRIARTVYEGQGDNAYKSRVEIEGGLDNESVVVPEGDVKKYEAGTLLKIRNFFGSPKNAVRDAAGRVLDKRKMAQGGAKEFTASGTNDLEDLAAKTGLSPEELEKVKFYRRFSEEDGKIVETLSRDKTEDEEIGAARDLLKAELARITTQGAGADLLQSKESLEKHAKGKASAEELLQHVSADKQVELRDKMADEEKSLQELVSERQEQLDEELAKYKEPLMDEEKGLTILIDKSAEALTSVKAEEKRYNDKIRDLTAKINAAAKLELAGDVQADIIKDFEQQKKQAELNNTALRDRRQALETRQAALKTNHKEITQTLKEINNIGKTKTELRAEKEAEEQKKKAEAEQAPGQADARSAGAAGEVVGEEVEEIIPDGEIIEDDLAAGLDGDAEPPLAEDAAAAPQARPKGDGRGKVEAKPKNAGEEPPKPPEETGIDPEKKPIVKTAAVWIKIIEKITGTVHREKLEAYLAIGSEDQRHYDPNQKFYINPPAKLKEFDILQRFSIFLQWVKKLSQKEIDATLEDIKALASKK